VPLAVESARIRVNSGQSRVYKCNCAGTESDGRGGEESGSLLGGWDLAEENLGFAILYLTASFDLPAEAEGETGKGK